MFNLTGLWVPHHESGYAKIYPINILNSSDFIIISISDIVNINEISVTKRINNEKEMRVIVTLRENAFIQIVKICRIDKCTFITPSH